MLLLVALQREQVGLKRPQKSEEVESCGFSLARKNLPLASAAVKMSLVSRGQVGY